MKRVVQLIFTVAVLLLASSYTTFAQSYALTGRVVDKNNAPISYATVVLLHDGAQVVGEVTNDVGEFSVKATAGEYNLVVSYIGYDELQQPVELRDNLNLGNLTLQESSVEIGAVEVKANLIRREADRYVVDVANSPHAVGRDASEMLKMAPGVWVIEDEIAINGQSGTIVYINNRESKLGDRELISLLRSMPADEIVRIDVLPQAGAEYDAAARGGVIHITTKRKVDTGLMGNTSLRASARPDMYSVRPAISLNYNRGNLNLYARANGTLSQDEMQASEVTSYSEGTKINSTSELNDDMGILSVNGGFIYDFKERNSIGAEVNFNQLKSKNTTLTNTEYLANNNEYYSQGDYLARGNVKRTTATMNYIYRLDELGSEFKILADYTNSKTPNNNDYHDKLNLAGAGISPRDSIYRSSALSNYHLATVTASIDKIISPKLILRAGAKYTFNKNTSDLHHEWEDAPGSWQPNTDLSYNIGFTENIGAAYVTATANLGRWSLVGGLRGEYTDFLSADRSVEQSYFDLFPNANVSYALTEDGSYSLIAQFARTIQRPGFWDLAPYENKSSEFSIMRGNPNLKATYHNSLSLTAVLGYKYSITLGMNVRKNPIEAVTSRDSNNPNMIVVMPTNLSSVTDYFANIFAPIDITKWWSANISFMGQYLSQRYNDHDPVRRHFSGLGSLMMSFILPKGFYIDFESYYTTSSLSGNIEMARTGDMNLFLKKSLLNEKMTISLGINNIVAPKARSYIKEDEFTSRTERTGAMLCRYASFAIQYRFNSGKRFNAKSIESGSMEDLIRLGGI